MSFTCGVRPVRNGVDRRSATMAAAVILPAGFKRSMRRQLQAATVSSPVALSAHAVYDGFSQPSSSSLFPSAVGDRCSCIFRKAPHGSKMRTSGTPSVPVTAFACPRSGSHHTCPFFFPLPLATSIQYRGCAKSHSNFHRDLFHHAHSHGARLSDASPRPFCGEVRGKNPSGSVRITTSPSQQALEFGQLQLTTL